MAAATAKAQRAASPRGSARSDKPTDYWRNPGEPKTIARHRFRAKLLRGSGKPALDLSNIVERIAWDDTSAILTGEIAFRQPVTRADISEGYIVALSWSPQGSDAYRELWRMRIKAPSTDLPEDSTTATLMDDLAFLQLSKDDFVYVVNKGHPHGWTIHQIVADICQRYGVRLGRIPRSKLRLKRFSQLGVSPLDAIIAALRKLREDAGHKLVLRYEAGRVIVEPLRRSTELLVMNRTPTGVSYSRSAYQEGFATVITAKGTARKGKHKRAKLRVRVESASARRRYGTVHQIVNSGGDTRSEVRRSAVKALERVKEPEQELTIRHPGIPTLRRGHAIRVEFAELGLRQIVFVKEVRHEVTGLDYEMSVTLRFDDPFVDAASKSSSKKRAAAAKKKGRTTKDAHSTPKPKPKRAAARADR